MRIGRLRSLIIIKQKVTVADDIGGVTETWTEYARVYGCQSVRRAWERISADQESSSLNVNWETRFKAGVSPDMRLEVNGHTFEILAVYDPSQKGERLMIVSRELQSPGVLSYGTADSGGEGNEGPDSGNGSVPPEGGSSPEEDPSASL